jgi:ribosomal protein S12 methylthiotransferase
MKNHSKRIQNQNTNTKKVHLVSLGCPKNLVDSENLSGILIEEQCEMVVEPQDAQIIMINTCGFIEIAKKEAIDKILEMAEYKRGNCDFLIVTGCLSQRYAKEIATLLPEVDAILGTAQYHTIAQTIHKLYADKKNSAKKISPQRPAIIKIAQTQPLAHLSTRRIPSTVGYAYLKIAEGCSNCCSYCAIPSIRGRYISRPMEDIVEEAVCLAKYGYYEIVLIAQDTTHYGVDRYGERMLVPLIRDLSQIKEIQRIRLLYCYSDGITKELISEIKNNEKIAKYIDIPIQHADDRILGKMNRKDTAESMRDVIRNLREEIPHITLRTTVMVGFPGETKEAFDNLLSFICEIRFDLLGCFIYSPEEGTPAHDYMPRVTKSVAEKRQHDIMVAQKEIAKVKHQALQNTKLKVVIEGFEDEIFYIGRGDGQAPEIDPPVYIISEDAPLIIGKNYNVKIVDVTDYEIIGVVC